jgi:predicted transcriptional regulator
VTAVPVDPQKLVHDQITLGDVDAQVYEAIATLEFTGHEVKAKDIAESAGIDDDAVRRALRALTQRGVLIRKEQDDEPVYEPARRGWSAAPDLTVNPRR